MLSPPNFNKKATWRFMENKLPLLCKENHQFLTSLTQKMQTWPRYYLSPFPYHQTIQETPVHILQIPLNSSPLSHFNHRQLFFLDYISVYTDELVNKNRATSAFFCAPPVFQNHHHPSPSTPL